MDFKLVNKIIAWFVFIFASVIYVMTVQPTFSFWDCGEFIACAYTLGVPHPPGAPFFILVGKIFTMLPIASDIGLRMNYLSVFSSSGCVALVYLIIVKLINNWRGIPKSAYDLILVCGSAAVGALAYAFSDSFWFSATESEVYGFGTLLIGVCLFLLMVWWEKADEAGSDKYLLLLAYVIGLSLGIHLIVVQCILIAGLMFYFRRYDYTPKGLLIAFGVTAVSFFVVYPGIVKKYPAIIQMSGILAIILFVGVIFGIYHSIKTKNSLLNIVCVSLFLIVLGYSTYIGVVLRANVDNLPINENKPDDIEMLLSYLNREQYGQQPLFLPRRYSQEPQHERTRQLYSSDMDFMWRYQINEMFNRYLFWQFIGREGYDQGDGVDFSKFFAIPFILGMFGVFYHFRKDWKLALVFLFGFLVLGVITALYQNQQDPQPRERDYFYVGAFMVFSMWIGLGVAGIIESINEFIKKQSAYRAVASGIVAASFLLVPINMLRVNYEYQNRHDNYFPYDYAYNILQSCEKDAILITNGDNDTFPLWCLQAVYGVRQDVRIVNLSLAQTDWYNLELKNGRPYGSLPVPMTYTDEQLRKLQPVEWDENKVFSIDIPKTAYPDSMQSNPDLPTKLNFKVPATIRQQYQGRNITAVKVNDLLLIDILRANKWERPIYFSVTVTDENYIGLGDYLELEGMAQKLLPYKPSEIPGMAINEKTMYQNLVESTNTPSKEPKYGFMFRSLDNPDVFYDQNHRRSVETYRTLFLRLANAFASDSSKYSLAKTTLDKMNEVIPTNVIAMDYRLKYELANIYSKIGDQSKFNELTSQIETDALKDIEANPTNVQSFYNPYRVLIDIYETQGQYQKALDILGRLQMMNPNDPNVQQKMNLIRSKMQNK
ncbi:MAG TPA: DUF2723 domain-containing protein [Ignavibacteria bacterium]|nr:DUF2723 domain-containing protein [Ignavibacteria bacterium]